MASWMVHLRIADMLLDRMDGLSDTEFVVGNIAPDSGVPNADWSSFTPSTTVSHFKKPSSLGVKDIDIAEYVRQYYPPHRRAALSPGQRSFYLGYLIHLLTDVLWSQQIARPSILGFPPEQRTERTWTVKQDWYDLDHKFLRDHPGFRSFEIYRNAVGFQNTYMDIFSQDAFDNRREYITGFYLQGASNLDREYPYLSEKRMNRFVEEAAERILVEYSHF